MTVSGLLARAYGVGVGMYKGGGTLTFSVGW